jgi:hypothetical protein
MKLIASNFLYYCGHALSFLLYCDLFAFLYPVYSKIMYWSMELDTDHKVWKMTINKRKSHEDKKILDKLNNI